MGCIPTKNFIISNHYPHPPKDDRLTKLNRKSKTLLIPHNPTPPDSVINTTLDRNNNNPETRDDLKKQPISVLNVAKSAEKAIFKDSGDSTYASLLPLTTTLTTSSNITPVLESDLIKVFETSKIPNIITPQSSNEPLPPSTHFIGGMEQDGGGGGVTSNAGTQTSSSPQLFSKKSNEHWHLGPMTIKERQMNVLLVFAREDGQSDGFWWATQKAGYKCDLVSNAETAVELYLHKNHDLVIIDRRDYKAKIVSQFEKQPVGKIEVSKTDFKNDSLPIAGLGDNKSHLPISPVKRAANSRMSSCFDPDTLCRSLRATKCNEYTIIVAVVNPGDDTNRETLLSTDIIKAGFNKYYIQNHDVNACLNELIVIENECFTNRCKLFGTKSLFSALDHIPNAVDISSVAEKEILYVNKAFEKLSEYSADELVRCSTKIFLPPGKVDQIEMANKFIAKSKIWEGNSVIETKSGNKVWHYCLSIPIIGSKNEVTQVVNVRTQSNENTLPEHAYSENYFLPRRSSMCSLPRNIDILTSLRNEDNLINNARRPSLARIRSMTIDAPITKVINILTNAQQNSPLTVSQALDRVLEILHTSELYTLGRAQFPSALSTKRDDSFKHHLPHNVEIIGGNGNVPHKNSIIHSSTSPITLGLHVRNNDNNDKSDLIDRDEDEKITADLVGNLAGINLEPRLSKANLFRKHSTIPTNYKLREVHPLQEIPDDVRQIINKDNEWDFPIFQLERLTLKRPLYYLAARIFQRFGVSEYLKVSDETLHAWLQMVESHYKPSVQYHNSTHAADVLQGTAYFLQNPLIREVLEEHEVMGALIAATIHDLDHPGRNSAFLCNAHADLAILYNDKSVLESHHVAFGFKLTLLNEQCNIFKNLSRDEFKALRRIIVEMVLATEMAKHFELLSKFLTFLDKCNSMVRAKKRRGTTQFSTASFTCFSTGNEYVNAGASTSTRRASLETPVISKESSNKATNVREDLFSSKSAGNNNKSVTPPDSPGRKNNIESTLMQIMHEEIENTSSHDPSLQGITINFSGLPPEKPAVSFPTAERSHSLYEITSLKNLHEKEIQAIRDEENAMGETMDVTFSSTDPIRQQSIHEPDTFSRDSQPIAVVSEPTNKFSANVLDSSFAADTKRKSSVMSLGTKRNYWREVLIELLVGSECDDTLPDAPDNNKDVDSSNSGTDSGCKPCFVSLEDAEKHRFLILSLLIKCADVSNPCRSLDVCKEWSKRIAEEYFNQTDEEKRLGLPVVMPTFDRQACNIPQSQLSFIDYFVNGMYEAWDSFCNVPELMENLKINYKYWKIMADDVKHKRISSAQLFPENSNSNLSP